MKNKKILFIGLGIILFILSLPFLIGLIHGTGITNEESIIEDDFYQQDLEEENNKKTSLIKNIFKEIIPSTYANGTSSISKPRKKVLVSSTNNIKVPQKLELTPRAYAVLEKYYILSYIDLSSLPTEVFLYGKYNWEQFRNVLNTYDYLNKTHKVKEYLKYKEQFKSEIFYDTSAKEKVRGIVRRYLENRKKLNSKNLSYFPKKFTEDKGFQFMIDGMYNHPHFMKVSNKLGKDLGYDGDLAKAAILTEQFRYAGTYRGVVKQYLKNTPFLFTMTKFSYGVGGIKEHTANKIHNDSVLYKTNWVFNEQNNNTYKNKSRLTLLKDTYWEIVYPNMLISNIVNRWDKAGYSISDRPGIILTLYNFGNPENKKPHGKPGVGGSKLIFFQGEDISYTYSFGGLGEALYYYIKIKDFNKNFRTNYNK